MGAVAHEKPFLSGPAEPSHLQASGPQAKKAGGHRVAARHPAHRSVIGSSEKGSDSPARYQRDHSRALNKSIDSPCCPDLAHQVGATSQSPPTTAICWARGAAPRFTTRRILRQKSGCGGGRMSRAAARVRGKRAIRLAVKGPRAAEWWLHQGIALPIDRTKHGTASEGARRRRRGAGWATLGTAEFFLADGRRRPERQLVRIAPALDQSQAGGVSVCCARMGIYFVGERSTYVLAKVCM